MLWLAALPCCADPILTPGYGLNLISLGSMPGTNGTIYSGLGFENGNLLLAAYNPLDQQTENIYSASVIRNAANQITGFGTVNSFTVSLTNDNSYGNAVEGGLAYLPNNTFIYTTATENYIGQFANGVSNLTSISDPVNSSAFLAGLGYLPGPGGAQQLVATFSDGDWFRVTATPNGSNPFYSIALGSELISGLSANSIAFDSPRLNVPVAGGGVLVGDITSATLALYGLDSNGNPLIASGVTLVNGNNEGIGYGVTVDPNTGNIIITGSNHDIWEVTVSTPEPASVAGVALILLAIAILLYRRRRATGSPA